MASLSYPPLYQYIEIDGRAFWSGGITSNSLLRELIYQHRTFYKYKIGAENVNEKIWNVEQNLQRVPD